MPRCRVVWKALARAGSHTHTAGWGCLAFSEWSLRVSENKGSVPERAHRPPQTAFLVTLVSGLSTHAMAGNLPEGRHPYSSVQWWSLLYLCSMNISPRRGEWVMGSSSLTHTWEHAIPCLSIALSSTQASPMIVILLVVYIWLSQVITVILLSHFYRLKKLRPRKI